MTDPREEDGIPVLSGDALAALQDFYNDRDAQQKRFEQLKAATEDASTTGGQRLSMDMFTEDWNASQFWYNDATATILARQLLSGATSSTHLAVVSAPSVFIQIKNLLLGVVDPPQVSLLEFDDRFAVLKEFVRYDFQQPMKLPREIPSFKLFESAHTLAFLDIQPLSKGHAPVAKKLAIATGAENYNILQNNGRIAHQMVDHVHFHMIPKPSEKEGLGISWPMGPTDMEKLKALFEEVKAKM
ncbi:hypothetical protein MMC19_005784 [Ptychographa xylographoides]|nr:hypothetical protein [Ptychographa xylographoides]